MKVLLVNKFFWKKGGAEVSFFETAKLLESKGHKVCFFSMKHPNNFFSPYSRYFISQVDYDDSGSLFSKIKAAGRILYSFEAKRKVYDLIKDENPDIIHLNNIHHQISPSILHTFKKFNLPVVMTLRDYKVVCASYSMLARNHPCELCKNGRYYQCFLNKCVKSSTLKSLLNTVEMYLHHDLMNIYGLVDVFISPSRFLMKMVKEMGFNKEVVYLPNFVDAGGFLPQYDFEENAIAYFGRLSKEKGIETLVEAIKGLPVCLKIIGTGPIEEDLRKKIMHEGIKNISFLGYKSGDDLKNEIKRSMAVVIPSEWYENNPRTVIEAFAFGKPVIGSRIGGIPELVKDYETGVTFEPGNVRDLRQKINALIFDANLVKKMGKNARILIEEEFNAEKHYQGLMEIYKRAMNKKGDFFHDLSNYGYCSSDL